VIEKNVLTRLSCNLFENTRVSGISSELMKSQLSLLHLGAGICILKWYGFRSCSNT
jgi:hypothetical protein